MDAPLDLDNPSSWCRLAEGCLRDIAKHLEKAEGCAIEGDLRPEGDDRDRAHHNAQVSAVLARRGVGRLAEIIEGFQGRLSG